jgi:hypothetical protein
MKTKIGITLVIILATIAASSCHSNSSYNGTNGDTGMRTQADTVISPGTPGPTGSQPGPNDTTQAHRDSLKHAAIISDTAK